MSGPTRLAARVLAVLAATAITAEAAALQNGRFTVGSDDTPTGWRREAWNEARSRFGWNVDAEGAGAVSITNLEPNDARWCQKVAVEPDGLYRVQARVKTRDVGIDAAGAFVSIEPRVTDTRLVVGTTDWQRVDVVARAAPDQREWDVCVRLGSYGSLNTGSAWFTDVALIALAAPAAAPAGPSALARLWATGVAAGWVPLATPIVAALLLAFGLGILGGGRLGAPAGGRPEGAPAATEPAGETGAVPGTAAPAGAGNAPPVDRGAGHDAET